MEVLKYKYIAIEGNIGAGKTTLAKILAKKLNTDIILEEFMDNPFLPQFYKNPDRYALPVEMSFLADRHQQLSDYFDKWDGGTPVISDYFLDKSLIFSKTNLKGVEWDLYKRFYNILSSSLPKPDVVVYLNRSLESLKHNIQRRGRSYESGISSDYLGDISKAYLAYFKSNRKVNTVILDVKNQDFISNYSFFKEILEILM